jgi:hypothetical protein
VGINTNTPESPLHVYQPASAADCFIKIEHNGVEGLIGIDDDDGHMEVSNTLASGELHLKARSGTGTLKIVDGGVENNGRLRCGMTGPASPYGFQMPDDVLWKALAQEWATYSDSRVKFNQRPYEGGLDSVLQLQPKRFFHATVEQTEQGFNILEDKGVNTIGLIAQEVHKILPEFATPPQDETKELWSLNYGGLVTVLVKAVQELKAEVEALKAKIV